MRQWTLGRPAARGPSAPRSAPDRDGARRAGPGRVDRYRDGPDRPRAHQAGHPGPGSGRDRRPGARARAAGRHRAVGRPPQAVGAVLDPLARRAGPAQFTGSVTDPATGTLLWSRTAGTPLVPGSTAKLLTSAATLLTLDPTERLVTRVVAGPEPGTVVLVGGGDPTLTALPAGKVGASTPTRHGSPRSRTPCARPRRCPCDACSSTPAATAARRMQPTWDPVDVDGGYVTPIEPADARRRPQGPRGAGRRTRVRPGPARPGAPSPGCWAPTPGASPRAPPRRAPPCSARSPPHRSPTSSSTRSARRTTCSPRCWPARSRSSAKAEPSFEGAAAQTLLALSQAGFDTAGARTGRRQRPVHRRPGAGAAARCGAGRGGGPGPGSARHPVPAADRHGAAGRGRRRHPGRPVRERIAVGLGPRRGPGEDRHADGGEQPRGHRRPTPTDGCWCSR